MTLKDEMGLLEDLTYLNHASIGPLPRKSFEILQQENKKQMLIAEEKINYEEIDELWGQLRKSIAKLLKGSQEGVTITTNTASGLHIVADCLQKYVKPKQNIVLPNEEFVTNSYVWQQVAKRYNLELRTFQLSANTENYDDWNSVIDDNTLLITLSHVQFGNGFRSDLNKITELAHDVGAYICVDAIQSLGIVPFDAKKFDVDFVAAAGYKWLLAPLGSGLLYTRPEIIDDMNSILVGWFSTPNYQELSHNEFTPWSDGRKFQQSMINPVWNSFNESLNHILRWDVNKSYAKVLELQNRLIEGIEEMENYSIGSLLKRNERSGILKIECKRDPKSLVENLGSKNITVAYRDGGIRISPHAYNDNEDIDRLIEALNNWK